MFEPLRIDETQGIVPLYDVARGGSAVSSEAQASRAEAARALADHERSQSLFGSKAAAIAEIWTITNECAVADWDGYGALAVDRASAHRAVALVRALPLDLPVPDVGAEPDGCIAFEWWMCRGRVISLSASASGPLPYAWLDGPERGHGIAEFDEGHFPARVASEIRRMMGLNDVAIRTV